MSTSASDLWKAAKEAYERRDYDAEVLLRCQLCEQFPDDMNCLHNLGLAFLNQGKVDDAIEIFEQVLSRNPGVSRAYNNLANALLQKGVELKHLVEVFRLALLYSESYEDLVRHFVNLCISGALGQDQGNHQVLDEIAITIKEVIGHCSGDAVVKEGQLNHLLQVLDAHRGLADYREAFAAKRWVEAEKSLQRARDDFERLKFSNRLSFIDTTIVPTLRVCKSVFAFIEQVASGRFASAKAAAESCDQCRNDAIRVRESIGRAGIHVRFFDAMGWFLTKLLVRLNAMVDCGRIESADDVPTEIIGLLTAESFTGVGADLLSMLNAIDRQCQLLSRELAGIADDSLREAARQGAWLRVALQCSSLTFDFRNVSHDIARSILGWSTDYHDQFRRTLETFTQFVERQASAEIYCDGKPKESIGRVLLQAHLTSRSYREVPVRGGRCDILAFTRDGKRVVIETKIWRGTKYHEQGLRELAEYLEGEATDEGYLGAFYVVFDPTRGARAADYLGGRSCTQSIGRFAIDVVVVRIALPAPSKRDTD